MILPVISIILNYTENLLLVNYLLIILKMMTYLKYGTGETLVVLIIYLGVLTNTFLNIVDHVGLKELLLLWPIELILKERTLGLKLL